MTIHTAIVDPDGTVRVPADGVQPGETVAVRIQRAADHHIQTDSDREERLTVLTADTPEKRARFRRQIHEWNQGNRAQLSQEDRDFDQDGWLYDENGLPR